MLRNTTNLDSTASRTTWKLDGVFVPRAAAHAAPAAVEPPEVVSAEQVIKVAKHSGVPEAIRLLDSLTRDQQGVVLKALAQEARKRGEVSVADNCYDLYLKQWPGDADMRKEYGELLESHGLLTRALQVYEGARLLTDAIVERHIGLLCRLRRFDTATTLLGSVSPLQNYPRACAVMYKFNGSIHLSTHVPVSTALQVDFASGRWKDCLTAAHHACTNGTVLSNASSTAPNVTAIALTTAEYLEHMCCFDSAPHFESMAATLSFGPFKQALMQVAAALADGSFAALREKTAAWIASIHEKIEIGKELRWKLTILRARMGKLDLMGLAVSQCESGQRWRVWLEGAKMEKDCQKQRALIAKALKECPERHRSTVLIEGSALEQDDDVIKAELLSKAWRETGDWKVALERCMLLLRLGRDNEAVEILKDCLITNPNAGRIWAMLCRLSCPVEVEEAAMRLVPKSGELWCEIGRRHARLGHWDQSSKYFDFAVEFTPQYGDIFLEMMRASLARTLVSRFGFGASCSLLTQLELKRLSKGHHPSMPWDTSLVERSCVAASPNHGLLWDTFSARGRSSVVEVLAQAKLDMIYALESADPDTDMMDALFDSWRMRIASF